MALVTADVEAEKRRVTMCEGFNEFMLMACFCSPIGEFCSSDGERFAMED